MNVIDTLRIYQALKEYLPSEAAQFIAQTFGYLYGEVTESLKKKDLEDVRDSIAKLEEAQDRVAKHLEEIDQRLLQLAEAQARTEARVEELAAAQARTEKRLEELAAAQARTEKRLEELAAAQTRTEERIDSLALQVQELAAAQARTEERLEETRKEVGGLSMAVGYGLEDRVIPYMPFFAEKTYRMKVQVVDRRFIPCDEGQYEEVNIYVEGTSEEGHCFLIGECKAQPGKKDADRFAKKLARLSTKLNGKIFPLFVGYLFSPEVEEYFRTTYPEVRIMKSFQFPLLYGERVGYF